MPRVSVVIPLYQTEAYIGAALASAVAQSYRDIEIIVVDDGSRDAGPQIARSWPDPRVRVVTQENRGLAGARNTGIRHATGEFVALLDADDIWEPAKLAKHVAHFDADPALDVSFSDSRLIDGNGEDLGLIQSPLSPDVSAVNIFCRNPVGNGSAPVLRRSALDRIAFEDERLGRTCWFDESFRQSEDVECWMRLKVIGDCRFGRVPEALTLYRVNSGGLSANIDAQLATWRRFRDKVATYAPDVIAEHGRRAEAYQLRYLARRAVRSADRAAGLHLTLRALRLHPRILAEEPMRTGSTLAAAVAKRFLPRTAFQRLEARAMASVAARPALRA